MGIIALDSSLLNVRGVAFVLPYTAQPGHRTGDRIYSNGMLVADSDDQLVPSWAFFCRAVVDSGDLPLTASREALLESNSKSFVSERLGARLLSELIMVQGMAPDVYQDIIRLHSAGLKSLAVQGPDMLSLLRTSLPLTTTMGKFTLDDLIRQGDDLAYVSDAGAYAALEEVAVHADALVIDAGGPHDQALLERINKTEQQRFREVDADHIVHLAKPENHPDSAAADRVAWLGAEALAEHRINVQVALFAGHPTGHVVVRRRSAWHGQCVGHSDPQWQSPSGCPPDERRDGAGRGDCSRLVCRGSADGRTLRDAGSDSHPELGRQHAEPARLSE
ncbi:hypothetical protein [Ornithinimicrobium sp. INDO-MA30-4]|uniref:hypothetical protein n=1 Tax=Ornithinimicrobium sp. INDO-MA30-4 TaxID=2908651 RepID=UPI001F3E4803|nr:hypothetical protein [Ornithinimicrobium sp. INDO-MA30-4]UJH70804.1 hypothetical protein L0A91_01905 [Ornithinimicrobium sp. INDO-MA30-4]